MRRRAVFTVVVLAVAFGCAAGVGPAAASIGSSPDRTWVTNGSVLAIARSRDTVYIGGNFTFVGPRTGPGVLLGKATGHFDPKMPEVAGELFAIHASVPDGRGGWFIGGRFQYVGGFPRANMAHILADRSVDPNFAPDPNETVDALAVSGSTVYVAGRFTTIGGQARHHLAALDARGQSKPWDPSPDGEIHALAVSDSIVYAGGGFISIGGQPRKNIAALDAVTAQATAWDPGADDRVDALAVSDSIVYAGGGFTSIGGEPRNRIGAVDAATGQATPWDPNASSSCSPGYPCLGVKTLAVSDDTVYVGGYFYAIGGQMRNKIAALDIDSGQAKPWNPDASSGSVEALAVSRSTSGRKIVYVAGTFETIGGQSRSNIAMLDAETGHATTWNPRANGTVSALTVSGSTVFAGGRFNSMGGETRNCCLAAIDARSGQPTAMKPRVNGNVFALAFSGSTLYVGGRFAIAGDRTAGDQWRDNIAAFDAATGRVTPWNPRATGCDWWGCTVYALALSGSTVYAGGTFTSIGGQARNYLAALDAQTGGTGPWNPSPDRLVEALAVSGSTIYAGGAFDSIGGQQRNSLAAVDADTGEATSWNPNLGDQYSGVEALLVSGSTVYAGGNFSSIGGEQRNGIAALDANTAQATSWNPNASNGNASAFVDALAVMGSTVFAGGRFTSIGGEERKNIAGLDADTGQATSWDPRSNGDVRSLAAYGQTVYAGGEFWGMTRTPQSGVASFSEPPLAATRPLLTGTPALGRTLRTSNGSWTGSAPMSFSYAWFRDRKPIRGATRSRYVVRETDRLHALSVRVTARNLGGSASASSNPVRGRSGCRVPRVIGLRFAVARTRIRNAHCSVGRIRRMHSLRRPGRVVAQSLRPGSLGPVGLRVGLVVGRG